MTDWLILTDLTAEMYTTYEDQWTWQILLIAFLISAAAGVVIILIVIFTCFRGNRVSLSAEHRKFDDSNEMTAQPRNATNIELTVRTHAHENPDVLED